MSYSATTNNDAARRRWAVYGLLITLATGQMLGRLMAVDAVDYGRLETNRISERLRDYRGELVSQGVDEAELAQRVASREGELQEKLRLSRPFLSANDRSRWMAIRALVEHGTFAIDEVWKEPTWDTIDMVKHPDREGKPRLYSSKPPLLYVLLAGEYWVIHKVTGATLGTHPYAIGRFMLVTINILPMALMLSLIAGVVERLFDRLMVADDWPRIFVVAAASFGTMLNTFAVVLNNHTVAAVSATVALYAWTRIRLDGDHRLRWFVLAGFAAAFTAADELPALAFLAFLGGLLLIRHPAPTLKAFVPAALVVVVAFFAANYAAHNSLRPPYMHRSQTNPADNWYDYSFEVNGRERESYWRDRQGIDRGEESRATYALHVLVGHHGVFSLTPMWLLSIAGASWSLLKGRGPERELAALALALTVICLTFFIALRPLEDRNYGGMTSGFRWMFWLAPLWLATMPPAVMGMSRGLSRQAAALVLLAMSAFSAAYPTWNPWTQPWIYRWMEACGWL